MASPIGFWVNDYTYRMYDARTHRTRSVSLVPLDGGLPDPEETKDVVEEYKERFEAECREVPTHTTMPLDQQHELAPHLRSIEKTKRRFRETGNHRYTEKLGGLSHA